MGLLDKEGPGYTVEDLVYWSGFIGGVVITYGILFHVVVLELHPIVRLLGMLVVGVSTGFVCERIYRLMKPGKRPEDEQEPPAGA
jgi:hypothetical protein